MVGCSQKEPPSSPSRKCRNETAQVLERPGPALFEEVDDTEERHEIAFPFDPCQLRNAHQFIFQFYREWEDGVDGDDAGLTSSAVTSSPRDFNFEFRMWVEGVWRSSNSSIRFPLVF